MGLTPLHLAAGRGWRVDDDGRALRVEAAGRAPAWFPYRRMSHVVSATDVQWHARALLACLQAGVPVCFVDGHGQPQGYCYGARRRETTLGELLALAIDSPEWELRHRTWRIAVERRLALAALHRAGLQVRHVHPEAIRSALCNAWFRRLRQPVAALLAHLDGAVHAVVAAHLQRLIPAEVLGHPRQGWCLTDELADLLRWPAFELLEGVTAADLAEVPLPRLAAQCLADSPLLEQALAALLVEFEHWLRSWVL